MGGMPFHVVSGKERKGLSTHYEEATNHPIFLFCEILPFTVGGRATKVAERRWWEMLSCEAELAMESYIVEKL